MSKYLLAATLTSLWLATPHEASATEPTRPVLMPPGQTSVLPPAPAPETEDESRSPALAGLISLTAGYILPAALMALADEHKNVQIPLGIAAGTLFVIGPSMGHVYADGTWLTTGFKIRVAGSVLVLATAAGTLTNGLDLETSLTLIAAGGVTYFVGSIYDIATAPSATRRRNARDHARSLRLAPSVSQTGAGLIWAGSF